MTDLHDLARKGGETTVRRHGSEHMRQIAALGGRASKGVKKKKRTPLEMMRSMPGGPATKAPTGEEYMAALAELDRE